MEEVAGAKPAGSTKKSKDSEKKFSGLDEEGVRGVGRKPKGEGPQGNRLKVARKG